MQPRDFALDTSILHGAVSGGAGPALLCLHGVTRTWEDFGTFLPLLPAEWRLTAIDLRGHGRSSRSPTGAYRVIDYAEDVAELIERHVETPQVALYGHSLGSLVALAAAARVPGRVSALVLEDPPLDLVGPRIQRSIYYDMFVGYRELLTERLPPAELLPRLAALLVNVPGLPPGQKRKVRLGEIRDPASLRYLTDCLDQLDPAVMAPLVSGEWTAGLDLPALLSATTLPTLVLQGNPDLGGMCTDADAAQLAARLPHCRVVKFAEVGHLIHVMAPEAAARKTAEFLGG